MLLNIEKQERLELGDLVQFIAKTKDIEYQEAERLVPWMYFEGAHICDDQGDEDWCKEVVQYLIDNNIDAVEIYQD